MNWYEFKRSLKTGLREIYVFLGKEDTLKEKGLALITSRLKTDNIIKMDSQRPAGD